MPRRERDFYPTPGWATQELLDRQPGIYGKVLEPCAGQGHISNVLRDHGCHVYENDISPGILTGSRLDVTEPESWDRLGYWDWIITNPPFSLAPQILPLALDHVTRGMAMLMRLSYLEPCENRAQWLEDNPPDDLLVLPRISFTGDGKTDSVTCAWMVWRMGAKGQTIGVVRR